MVWRLYLRASSRFAKEMLGINHYAVSAPGEDCLAWYVMVHQCVAALWLAARSVPAHTYPHLFFALHKRGVRHGNQ
jgi:hypothetical protein